MDDPVSPRLAEMRREVLKQLPNRSFVAMKVTQDAVIAESTRKDAPKKGAVQPKPPPSLKVSKPLSDSATVLEQLEALQQNTLRHAKHGRTLLSRQHSKNMLHIFEPTTDALVSAHMLQPSRAFEWAFDWLCAYYSTHTFGSRRAWLAGREGWQCQRGRFRVRVGGEPIHCD